MAVESTEAMACSALFSAAPANHLALCSAGSLSIKSWNRFRFFTGEGAIRSWSSLNTKTIWRFWGGQYSAISRITDASSPSAAS